MTSLYELTNHFATAVRVLNQAETPEDEKQALEDVLNAEFEREQKLANCCAYIKNLESDAEQIALEINKLKLKKERIEARRDAFERYLAANLMPGETWSNGVHSLGWRKSEGVVIAGEVPEQYMREIVKVEPDKAAIKRDLKLGAEIPGAFLEVRNNLQIK